MNRTQQRGRRDPRRPRSGGQATVEFALCLPLVVMAALFVIQAALVVRAQLLTVNAAREGARAAAVGEGPAKVRVAALRSGLAPERTTVVEQGADGAVVAVTVTHRAPTVVPLVGALLPDITVHATVTMRVEQPDTPAP